MRVKLTHNLADNTLGLHVALVGAKSHLIHLEQDASLHGLKSIACVWECASVDDRDGVFQEGGSHLFGDIDFTDVFVRNGEWFYEVLLSHIRDYHGRKNLCSTPTPNAGTIRG
ncbi:Uncharacterised protein [Chlamydia trachomatis]|nr:Uncharacterised protein [Chlamydia trachomatis]